MGPSPSSSGWHCSEVAGARGALALGALGVRGPRVSRRGLGLGAEHSGGREQVREGRGWGQRVGPRPRRPSRGDAFAGGRPGLYIVAGCWGICSTAWGRLCAAREQGPLPPRGTQLCPARCPTTAYSSSGASPRVSREDSPLGSEAVSSVTALGQVSIGSESTGSFRHGHRKGADRVPAPTVSVRALGTSQLKAENRGKEYLGS